MRTPNTEDFFPLKSETKRLVTDLDLNNFPFYFVQQSTLIVQENLVKQTKQYENTEVCWCLTLFLIFFRVESVVVTFEVHKMLLKAKAN